MVTVAVAGGEAAEPSSTVYVNEPSLGLHTLAVGVKVTVAESLLGLPPVHALLVIAPSEPLVARPVAKVSSQVSTSVPVRVTRTGVSSVVSLVTEFPTGVSLAQVISTVTGADVDANVPSFTV